jgi:2-iminobutanoate/2-iminopropanoate deaminase
MANIEEETRQVMENLGVLLRAAGLDHSHLVKVTIFLSDMAHYGDVNKVYGSYFKDTPPTREAVAVKGLPRNVNVEISGIARRS